MYFLRLTADDGEFAASDGVTVTVNGAVGGGGGGGCSLGSNNYSGYSSLGNLILFPLPVTILWIAMEISIGESYDQKVDIFPSLFLTHIQQANQEPKPANGPG